MTTTRLEIRLFGTPEFLLAGESISSKLSQKGRALLAYLALEPQPVGRSRLAGLLWSDLPEEDARRNLRVELLKLRRVLPELLLTGREELQFSPKLLLWLDVSEFRSYLQRAYTPGEAPEAEFQALQEAAGLYQGDFLQALQLRGAPLFEEWAVLERESLRQQALDAFSRLAQYAANLGYLAQGLSAARWLVAADSWREESHRLLMLLLALSGDRTAALAQYERFRRILSQEFGVQPGPEIQSLAEKIRAGQSPKMPPARETPGGHRPVRRPHNLPAPTTPFVGRETELAEVAAFLRQADCRLLTLVGTGGIGKTRLALETAWRLEAEDSLFEDGINFIFLAPLSDAALLPAALSSALELPLAGAQAPWQQLLTRLRTQRRLLVLDNFESLIEAAPQLSELLQAAAGLKMLVTSRSRLDLYGEWVYPLEGLPVPVQAGAPGWEQYPAIQLFQQQARRVNLRFSMVEQAECVVSLCELLEGLPLGIELAAAWTSVMSCADITRAITANLQLPDSSLRNLPERQRSLRALFRSSWELLSDGERLVLGRLALFQGGFTASAAEQVAGARPRQLASLAGKSLVRFSPHGRYDLHNLLQMYAVEQLPESESAAVRQAHARYFAAFLKLHQADFSGAREEQAVAEMLAEIDNLRQGWSWAASLIPSTDPTNIPELVGMLEPYLTTLSACYTRLSWFREAEALYAAAVSAMQQAGWDQLPITSEAPRLLALAQLSLAQHCLSLGQVDCARSQAQSAIQALRQLGPSIELANNLRLFGLLKQASGDPEPELDFQASLAIYRRLEHSIGIAANLMSLGVLAKNRGNLPQAEGLYLECLEIFRQRSDQRGIWTCLINLGNIANVKQDFQEALRLYQESYSIVENSVDKSRQALTLINLGSVAREIGEFEQGIHYYQKSQKISEETGEIRTQIASLDGLGKTYLNQGAPGQAEFYLHKALQTAVEAGHLPQALDCLGSLGRLQKQLGQVRQALRLLSFVAQHPSSPGHVKGEALSALEKLSSEQPQAIIEKETRLGAGLSLEAVLNQTLTSSPLPGKIS